MSRLKLTHWQRRRLHQQLKSTSDARTYRRTLAVLVRRGFLLLLHKGGAGDHDLYALADKGARPAPNTNKTPLPFPRRPSGMGAEADGAPRKRAA